MRGKPQKTRKAAQGLAETGDSCQGGVGIPSKSPEGISGRNSVKWPVFDSMDQCAGATGIPKERLQSAKNAGAPGFSGSRIYFGDLLPWFFKSINKSTEPIVITYGDLLDKQKFEERAGILCETDAAISFYRECLLPIRQAWLGMASTMAPRCNPSDPEHARKALDLWTKTNMRLIADAEKAKIK